MSYKKINCLQYPVFCDSLDVIPSGTKTLITTINQYSYCIADKDDSFREALKESDILLPDGMAIVLAVRFLKGEIIKKIAGNDLHNYLLDHYNSIGGSCFYLGASENTLEKIHERLKNEYPNLRFGSYSPPFKPQFSDDDNRKMINAVNAFKPDVLFIGMTAPKQEKWAYKFKDQLQAKEICCIGAVFDFYAGTVRRPGEFWINIGLEWFIRLIKEPQRLWKRYLYYGPIFVFKILKERLVGQRFNSSVNMNKAINSK